MRLRAHTNLLALSFLLLRSIEHNAEARSRKVTEALQALPCL